MCKHDKLEFNLFENEALPQLKKFIEDADHVDIGELFLDESDNNDADNLLRNLGDLSSTTCKQQPFKTALQDAQVIYDGLIE